MSKPIECTISRMNPNVNHGLWLIMICQCWFINCNKCTTAAQDVDNRGGCVFVKAEGNVNFVYFLLNLAGNLKVL